MPQPDGRDRLQQPNHELTTEQAERLRNNIAPRQQGQEDLPYFTGSYAVGEREGRSPSQKEKEEES